MHFFVVFRNCGPASFWHFCITADLCIFGSFCDSGPARFLVFICDRGPVIFFAFFFDSGPVIFGSFCYCGPVGFWQVFVTADLRVFGIFE